MSSTDHLTADQLYRAISLRDLTDPSQGPHAMQPLLAGVVDALEREWGATVRTLRGAPIVPVRDNYDRLGYGTSDVTRARRYTRYVSPTVMLRSHMSADLPAALEGYGGRDGIDELIVAPGLVYRRDVVDLTHVGEPHQVDLWRIRSNADTSDGELLTMIERVVEAVLPGAEWRVTESPHSYTVGGRQVDVLHGGEWLELAECGRIHPDVLRRSGLDPAQWSGLALGMGLERALMLRKGIPDIRYIRAEHPRVAAQMLTLEPWRHVSRLPATRRDISVVLDAAEDEETLGDRVRAALGNDADVVESVEMLGSTAHEELPVSARERMGTRAGQVNLLVRIVLRPIDRTLSADEANHIRNAIYRAVHKGPVFELI